MKIAIGVIIGIAISRPVLSVVDEHLTPTVRRKITQTLGGFAQRLSDRINSFDQDPR